MVSASTFVSDFNMMGGYTHGSLRASVEDIKYQFEQKMFAQVAKVMYGNPDVNTYHAPSVTGKSPSAAAEVVIDSLTEYLPVHLGSGLDDFAILVPTKMNAVLNRGS
ncbi:hypothetical protein FD733_02135 [Pantoea sp. Eser]|nr:hypothetical protein [Pantoea sp. Eser]